MEMATTALYVIYLFKDTFAHGNGNHCIIRYLSVQGYFCPWKWQPLHYTLSICSRILLPMEMATTALYVIYLFKDTFAHGNGNHCIIRYLSVQGYFCPWKWQPLHYTLSICSRILLPMEMATTALYVIYLFKDTFAHGNGNHCIIRYLSVQGYFCPWKWQPLHYTLSISSRILLPMEMATTALYVIYLFKDTFAHGNGNHCIIRYLSLQGYFCPWKWQPLHYTLSISTLTLLPMEMATTNWQIAGWLVGWLYWGLTPLEQLRSYHGGR